MFTLSPCLLTLFFTFFELCVDTQGLTGLLQSPIKGAEKHGLPGVVSGITS